MECENGMSRKRTYFEDTHSRYKLQVMNNFSCVMCKTIESIIHLMSCILNYINESGSHVILEFGIQNSNVQ